MWKVLVRENVLEFLDSLDKSRRENIKKNLRFLRLSPYPGQGIGDKKEIKGSSKSAYRMRIGDYRAFYIIEDNKTIKVTELMTAETAHKKYGMI